MLKLTEEITAVAPLQELQGNFMGSGPLVEPFTGTFAEPNQGRYSAPPKLVHGAIGVSWS